MHERNALVVDDHPTNRLLAGALLKKLGWTVQEAETGDAALIVAAQHDFRLVMLDISMPGLSGEATCSGLTAIAHTNVMARKLD
ncbi:MAG: response regulator [Azonexus sp.]|nr:response regulator [Azonexus sp.]